ncbi:MAG: hypothetical protein ACJ71K_20865 [Nitrososphaeraceae archaeon]
MSRSSIAKVDNFLYFLYKFIAIHTRYSNIGDNYVVMLGSSAATEFVKQNTLNPSASNDCLIKVIMSSYPSSTTKMDIV